MVELDISRRPAFFVEIESVAPDVVGSCTPFLGLQCTLSCRCGQRVYTICRIRRNLSRHTNCISSSALYRRFYEPTTHADSNSSHFLEEKCWGQWGDYRGPFTFLVAFEKCVSPGGVNLMGMPCSFTDASAAKTQRNHIPDKRFDVEIFPYRFRCRIGNSIMLLYMHHNIAAQSTPILTITFWCSQFGSFFKTNKSRLADGYVKTKRSTIVTLV